MHMGGEVNNLYATLLSIYC